MRQVTKLTQKFKWLNFGILYKFSTWLCKIFGVKPVKGNLDPAIKALISKDDNQNKEITFDERIDKMFKKLATNAVRHKNNFRHTNYDLDRKVTKFMKEREHRIFEEKEKRRVKEEKIPIANSDDEDGDCDSTER